MANRVASSRIPHPSVPSLDVNRVKTSLRKPFSLPSSYRWLTLAAVLLGVFISIEWRAPVARGPVTPDYPRELGRQTIVRLEAEQKGLKQAISDLRAELAAVQNETAGRKSALTNLNSQLESQRALAGLTALAGPGVQVTLDDSGVKSIPAGEDPGHYIVHDYDIRDIVALLWQSGAEAIAISGERVVASTSIYCVGSTILVNDVRMSPPYQIVAVGPPSMEEMLGSPARLQKLKSDVRQYGVQFKVAQAKELRVPAFTGRFAARFAKPGSQ